MIDKETLRGFDCIDLLCKLLKICLITTCKTNYGIFIIKFMQLWSNDGLSHFIANVLYCPHYNMKTMLISIKEYEFF